MLELRSVLAGGLALAALTASAQQYRWLDEKGGVQYSDTPPPASARDVRTFASPKSQIAAASDDPSIRAPVTLYTAPNCAAPCRDSRRLLDERGVPYTEFSAFNESSIAELKRATGDARIPSLTIGDNRLVGFSAAAWNAALDGAGYPAKGPATKPSRPALTLYTNSKCGEPCADARTYLQERKLEFSEVPVEERADVENLRKLTGQQNVPVLMVGNLVQRGFDPGLYARALEAMGYTGDAK